MSLNERSLGFLFLDNYTYGRIVGERTGEKVARSSRVIRDNCVNPRISEVSELWNV